MIDTKKPLYNINIALDDFLYDYGLTILTPPCYSKNDKLLGFTPKIKIYPVNKINRQPETIGDFKNFKSADRAQKVIIGSVLNMIEEHLTWYPTTNLG